MDNPLSEENLTKIFKTSSSDHDRLIKREDSNHEFKESYSNANMSMYFKTIAAFANNDGGYIIFGIKDSPHVMVGLSGKSLEQFENLKIEVFTQNLNDYFTPSIKWISCIFEFKGKKFGIVYIYKLHNKPAICKKNYDCSNGSFSLKDGDIYFRYAGRSEKIKSTDLQNIIDERRRNEENQWLNLITKVAKIGIDNSAIMDLANGDIETKNGTMVVDEQLLGKIKFIKEGEFNEKVGAPTLRIVGDIDKIQTSEVIKAVPVKVVKAIEQSDIIEDFLCQRIVEEPKAYIKHICSCFSGNLPVYYYINLAKMTIEDTITLVSKSTSRYNGKTILLKRLNGQFAEKKTIKEAKTELQLKRQQYIDLWEKESIEMDLIDVRACVSSIVYIDKNVIQQHKAYILDKIQNFYKNYYENANGSLASDFRKTIVYLDEALYCQCNNKEQKK